MQLKVYVQRKVHKEKWSVIAPQVKNMKGKDPYWQVCRDAVKRMTTEQASNGYSRCGKNRTITPELRKWLASRLLVLRKKTVCTPMVLQRELVRHKGVDCSGGGFDGAAPP